MTYVFPEYPVLSMRSSSPTMRRRADPPFMPPMSMPPVGSRMYLVFATLVLEKSTTWPTSFGQPPPSLVQLPESAHEKAFVGVNPAVVSAGENVYGTAGSAPNVENTAASAITVKMLFVVSFFMSILSFFRCVPNTLGLTNTLRT